MTTARNEHPDWNDLAALAEGAELPHADDLHRHLAGCRQCAAAHAEIVRIALHPERLVVPADLRQAAMAAGPASVRSRSSRPRLLPAFAAATALAAAVVFMVQMGNDQVHPAIQSALLQQTPSGLVLPGLIPDATSASIVYRDAGSAEIGPELQALAAEYRHDQNVDTAFWLGSGYLAAGRLEAAADLMREARRRHPDDSRLIIVDAVAAYRRSRLDLAEALLRQILLADPGHAVARYNLALVLSESGQLEEAHILLDGGNWSGEQDLHRHARALRDTLH